ncbi:hypothetical protein Cgig2_024762 [Carnegiea gigantea]|uniref:Uncharacterized protein n=1 Tax=Carnegiea gigantea TaxID=171969 RepID=A0A9Q1Q9P6_9CARY|nr:hypothetical protein Cgig2_024762 [Carnegiea gigantea]
MITRHNLVEQLREYQIRSKHDWASASFFSSTSHNNFTSRMDIVVFVIWELIILAFLVFSAVSLYFRHMQLAFVLICVTLLMLLCMKITKQIRQARKKKRRMLLPLSMVIACINKKIRRPRDKYITYQNDTENQSIQRGPTKSVMRQPTTHCQDPKSAAVNWCNVKIGRKITTRENDPNGISSHENTSHLSTKTYPT